jgi:hypothetical protein
MLLVLLGDRCKALYTSQVSLPRNVRLIITPHQGNSGCNPSSLTLPKACISASRGGLKRCRKRCAQAVFCVFCGT